MFGYIVSGVVVACFATLNWACIHLLNKRYPPIWILTLCFVVGIYSVPLVVIGWVKAAISVEMLIAWFFFLLIWVSISIFCMKVYSRSYTGDTANPNHYASLLQADRYDELSDEVEEDYMNGRLPQRELAELFPGCHPDKVKSFFAYLLITKVTHQEFRTFLSKELEKENPECSEICDEKSKE